MRKIMLMALGALLTAAVSFGATSTVVSKAVGPVSVMCENPGGWTFSVSLGRAADGVETVDIALTNATRAVPPEFKVTFDVPEQGMVHFWRPESIWTGQHLAMSKVKTRTNLVEWTPVYMVFNERDENRLAVALSEDVLPVTTTTGIREEDCASAWEIVYFKDADALRTGYSTRIRLDRRAVKTCEAIRSAADWICEARGFTRMPSPAHTYGPLYSTWYTFHRELDEKRVEAEYARAAKLGMTTAILDSGWQQEDSSLIAICNGDWDPAPNRFPDMKAHVARVHAMGLKYMLWFGPPFMGKRAKNFEHFKGMYHHIDHKWSNCGFLDPRYPEVREYVAERLVRAVRDWGFDGLKLDFLYDFQAMGQDPAKEKGYAGCDYRNISEATEAMMAEIRRRLVAVKPDVRLEIHMCYMTPSICRYGNQQHASDSCGSSAANRVAIAALRLTSGDMAVHADMLAWNATETPEDVGHMILGSIFGTIQYSVDLGKLSDAHTRVLKHWIDFTKAHEATLQHGRFTPHYPDREYPVIEAESAAERIVAVYKENCVADTGALDRPVLVVNGSGAKTVTLRVASAPARVRAYDVYGNEVTAPTVRAGLQDVAIPVSGYLVLEKPRKLRLDWPREGAEVSLLTAAQKAYLTTPTEKRVAGFDDPAVRAELATIGWKPAPVTFVWSGTEWDVKPATLEIRRESDGQLVRREDVSIRTRNAWQVFNLESGTAYSWRVTVAGRSSDWGRFSTEPGVRLVDVEGVPNFRDLGGRIGLDGRRVRQGLVYRSSGANRNSSANESPGADRITDAGRRVACGQLGVRTDLDLRGEAECKGMDASPFGPSVKWMHVSSGCYQWMSNAVNREAFARCFRTVNDSANLPLVFHCIGGQDRTGTLAFVLNALLGVAESELSLDWEMTIFWNPMTGWFSRKGRYEAMLAYFNDNFAGGTLREKVERYVRSCGIGQEEIDSFRERMLEPRREGAPVWQRGHFQTHFIHTGGGESIFLVYPDGTSLLIDCGDVAKGCPDGSRPAARVADYVRRVNPHGSKVDYLLLTHYHADHGGRMYEAAPISSDGTYRLCGLGEIVNLLDFGKAVDRAYPGFDDPVSVDMKWDDSMAANCRGAYRDLERRGRTVEKFRLEPGSDQLKPLYGGAAEFAVRPLAANGRILMPDGTVRGIYADFVKRTHPRRVNENALSIALRFSYGRFSLYTGGDIESLYEDGGVRMSLEEEFAKALGPVDVAKLNHHGLDCPRALAEALRPQVWVCTQWSACHLTDEVLKTLGDPSLPPANRLVLPQFRPPLAPVPQHVVVDVQPGGAAYDVTTVEAATGRRLRTWHFTANR